MTVPSPSPLPVTSPMAVTLPAGTETELGTVVPVPGAMTTVTVDGTVSPDAVTARPLSQLAAASVVIPVYGSSDGAVWQLRLEAAVADGTVPGETVAGAGVSAFPGHVRPM